MALFFWGVVTGNLLLAIVLALILEGQRWIPLKWEFDEKSHVKAFQLSLLLVAAGVVLNWLEDEGRQGVLNVVKWSPLMFFPVEFVQRYGLRDRVNLNSFFYFSRKSMEKDVLEGREVNPIQTNTGYPYVLSVLIASSTMNQANDYFFWCMCAFMAGLSYSMIRARGLVARWLFLVLPIVVLLGLGSAFSMSVAYKWAKEYLTGGRGVPSNNTFLADFTTRLSELGDVKQNPKIEWRVWSATNPEYLRIASYSFYHKGRWTYAYGKEGFAKLADSYQRHTRNVINYGGRDFTYFIDRNRNEVGEENLDKAIKIRGTVTHHSSSTVVPTSPGYYAVYDILGDEAYAEVNSMGSLHLENREMVINYSLLSGAKNGVVDRAPILAVDLDVPAEESTVISDLADYLKLRGKSASEVIATIRNYFHTEFEYSIQFDPGEVDYDRSRIEWFLNEVKCGHCEYYATAAVLLLREVGIPARYATGYAVSEWGGNCWNVRGTSGHAWARAYVDGEWINVDLTPPNYRGNGSHAELGSVEWLQEQISMIREDFFIWRQDPANSVKFLTRSGIVLSIISLWFIFRLWQHRKKGGESGLYTNGWTGEVVVTPLHKLERWIAKRVGPRQLGEPFGAWVKKLELVEGVDPKKVAKVIELHQMMRFDPNSKVLKEELSTLVKSLRKSSRKP